MPDYANVSFVISSETDKAPSLAKAISKVSDEFAIVEISCVGEDAPGASK
jgi:hypothetical protein